MKRNMHLMTLFFYVFVSVTALLFFVPNAIGDDLRLSKGQRVYVPVYSHIILGRRGKGTVNFDLLINLSIRNTDPENSIIITVADYYDSDGVVVKRFVIKPLTLKPMASTYFLVEQSDTTGGWGANYIIEWKSDKKVNEPIIESVTYGSRGTHSISFISQGKVIREVSDN